MSKIRIITDSACDMPKEAEVKYNIDILCFPITVGDRDLHDRDIPNEEYYDLIDSCPDMPVHSQLTVFQFEELYAKYDSEGYTDIFYIAINAHGSATYSNACVAADNYRAEHPDSSMNIRLFDSTSYSGAYGMPVIEASKMAEAGTDPDEIEAYLREWFEQVEVYLACYTLRYVKKSGRIKAAAAFAGELLGLKPVILLKGDETKVVSKPRGDQNVVPKLADIVCDRIEKGSPYCMIGGRDMKRTEEAAQVLTKRLGYAPYDVVFRVGGAVSSNAGPDMVAVAFKAKKN